MLPILFSIGPLNFYSFGFFLLIAFITGSFVVWHFGRQELSEELILDLILYLLIISFIGARIAYILSNPEIFEANFLKMLHIFNFPGFSYYWGLVTGIITITVYSALKKISLLLVMDFFVLGFALALIFAEMGCFLNGCAVGRVTNLFWGMPVIGFEGKRHPLPLYEIIILIPTIFLLTKKASFNKNEIKKREDDNHSLYGNGLITGLFFLILGVSQFVLEFLSESSVYLFNLKINQIINLIFIFLSLILLFKNLPFNSFKKKLEIIKNKK